MSPAVLATGPSRKSPYIILGYETHSPLYGEVTLPQNYHKFSVAYNDEQLLHVGHKLTSVTSGWGTALL